MLKEFFSCEKLKILLLFGLNFLSKLLFCCSCCFEMFFSYRFSTVLNFFAIASMRNISLCSLSFSPFSHFLQSSFRREVIFALFVSYLQRNANIHVRIQQNSFDYCSCIPSEFPQTLNLLVRFQFQYSLLQTAIEACQKKTHCKFLPAPKSFGGSPCPGIRKIIEYAYKCRPCK